MTPMRIPWQTKVVLILTFTAVMAVSGQSPTEDPTSAQRNQVRGYWIDPATKLMWAAKDNGRDVSWKGAVKYCRNLRLAGYSDWRLATIAELGEIYDGNANVPGLAGSGKDDLFTLHVKGNLFLTGDEWSSERIEDDRGHPSAFVRWYDFNEGRLNYDPIGWPYSFRLMRALCVHGPEK